MSRFGRNYKEAGHYLEHIFPYLGVRFVAINDHFDTADQGIHDGYIVPLTNILNESYSRDISEKYPAPSRRRSCMVTLEARLLHTAIPSALRIMADWK